MPKILIADDNTNIQKMVALAFEERGIQVVAVGNGEAAVRRLTDLNPDLVLADIFMPVRSGYEVCEYIKKDKNFAHVPVILLVGAFDPLDEKEARRVGADGVLKKPFVPPDPLIAMVMSALEKNPRIAAELAKSKEVIAEPPAPMPLPEVALKIESKPLPEFPEPTPEEAALVYGFGSGRRSILDEEKDRESIEPVEAETEEDTEGVETARDWRRAAMDFEVPEEAGGTPAFSDETAFSSDREPAAVDIPLAATNGDREPVAAKKFDLPVDAPDADAVPAPVASTPVAIASESEAIAAAPEISSESETFSNVPHWMDALSAEPSSGGWMARLFGKKKESQKAGEPEEVHAPLASVDLPAAETSNFQTEAQEEISAAVSQAPAGVSQASDENISAPAGEPEGESWFAPAPAAFDSTREAESTVPVAAAEDARDLTLRLIPEAADTQPTHREAGLEQPAAVRVTPEPMLDSEETAVPITVFRREQDLVVPPAVRVTPEPMLDSEEPQPSSQMYSSVEEMAPPHSEIVPFPASEPAAEEAAEAHADTESSPVESSVEEFSERIPTGPPPNREALAEIPFLTPPVEFHSHSEEAEINAQTVDAVVRKVLEKLEPQLHDLFSQGLLKPLVENLLQNELAKKNR